MTMKRGPLIVLSGPSGCGKSTVIRRVIERSDLPLRLSVSATTRPRRPNETDGVDYHFWTRERFEEELKVGSFLESARVVDNYYGTLRREVEPFLRWGTGVILDIDVQGKDQVRRQCPEALTIFLLASSPAFYEERLRKRGTETEAAIQRRLASGLKETSHAGEYDYQVLNDDLDVAVADVHRILTQAFSGDQHAG